MIQYQLSRNVQDTLRNFSKIYNDDVAAIITALEKKGTETVQLCVTCHTEYIRKNNISMSNMPFSKLKRLRSTVPDFLILIKTVCSMGKMPILMLKA